jgi:hypothetical protein
MLIRGIVLAGAAIFLAGAPAWAQGTITENINNTGIPRNAPALGLSNIYGLNPCSSGTSVGVTTPLFGIGGAVADIDKDCETRNNAAVVITGLKDETLAREILCTIKDIRQAAIRVGKPCLQDEPAPRVSSSAPPQGVPQPTSPAQGAPVAMATPTPVAVPVVLAAPVASAAPVELAIRPEAPAFCRTKGLDLSLYPDCTKASAPASTIGSSGPAKTVAKTSPTPPSAKSPVSRPDDSARATAQQHPIQPARSGGCEHGRDVTGGACQGEPVTVMALERTWMAMIAHRRVELALEAIRQRSASESSAQGPGAPAPSGHAALLADATPAQR